MASAARTDGEEQNNKLITKLNQLWAANRIFCIRIPFFVGGVIFYIVVHVKKTKGSDASLTVVTGLLLVALCYVLVLGVCKASASTAQIAFLYLSFATGWLTVCYQVLNKKSKIYPALILLQFMFGMTPVIITLYQKKKSVHPSSAGDTHGTAPSTDSAPTASEGYNPIAKLDEVLGCLGEMRRGRLGREKLIEDLLKRANTYAARADKADAVARSANERLHLHIAEAYNTVKRAAMNTANARKEIATVTKRVKELELELERMNKALMNECSTSATPASTDQPKTVFETLQF